MTQEIKKDWNTFENCYKSNQYHVSVLLKMIEEIDKEKYPLDNSVIAYHVALTYREAKNDIDCKKYLADAILLDDNYEDALRSLAFMLEDKNQLMLLERLIRKNLGTKSDMVFMANHYLKANRIEDAAFWYHTCLREKKEKEENNKNTINSIAYVGLAEIHAKLAIKYLYDAYVTDNIDLKGQISENKDIEDVLRFIYDNLLNTNLPQ